MMCLLHMLSKILVVGGKAAFDARHNWLLVFRFDTRIALRTRVLGCSGTVALDSLSVPRVLTLGDASD